MDKTQGKEKRMFEGGAIMLYLCEKYDKENRISFDYDTVDYWEMVAWITWMQVGFVHSAHHVLLLTTSLEWNWSYAGTS